MPIPAVIAGAAKVAAPFLLPIILDKVFGGALQQAGSDQPYKLGTGQRLNPKDRSLLDEWDPVSKAYKTKGPVPAGTKGSQWAKAGGNVLHGASNFVQGAAQTGLQLGGNLISGVAQGAGALTQAAGNIPKHITDITVSPEQQQIWGSTPLNAVGNIAADIGTGAGTMVSALGGSVGNSLSDLGKMWRLDTMHKNLFSDILKQGSALKKAGIPPYIIYMLMSMLKTGRTI